MTEATERKEHVEVHGISRGSGPMVNLLMKVPGISQFVEPYRAYRDDIEATLPTITESAQECPKTQPESWMDPCDGGHPVWNTMALLRRGALKEPTKSGANANQRRDPSVDYNYKWEVAGFINGPGPRSTGTVDTRLDVPESSSPLPPLTANPADARQIRIEWQSARRDAISLMAAYPDAFVTDDYIGEVFTLAQRLYDSGPNGHQSTGSITVNDLPWDDTDGPDLDLGTGVPIEAPSGPGEPDNSTDDGTITDGPALLFKIQQMTSKTACTANDLLALLGLQSLRDIKPVVGYDEAYAAALVKWGPRGS